MEVRASGAVALRPSPMGAMFVGAIKYNRRSGPIRAGAAGTFVEQIAPSAFVRSLKSGADVMGLKDHDPAMLLGRRSSGTLRMSTDDNALTFEIEAPATSYANDLAALLERGDIAGASFGFRVADNGDLWSYTDTGMPLRTLVDVDLLDLTICAQPAYPTSTASLHAAPMAMAPAMAGRSSVPVHGGADLAEARRNLNARINLAHRRQLHMLRAH